MGTSKYKPEAHLPGCVESLSSYQLEIVLFQMKNCICKIKVDNGKIGTGFFCKIPFPDALNPLPVLITNNHVLDNISQGKKINFSLNNDQISHSITINSSRKALTNKEKDVTIIEIKPQEDNIQFNSFLDIDEDIDHDEPHTIYNNISVYITHYENGNVAKYSLGKILNIGEDKYTIKHNCTTQPGSSGSPIINLNNFKIIGVHKGFNKLNLGTLLKIPIVEFNRLYKDHNSSEKLPYKYTNNGEISVIMEDEYQKSDSFKCQKSDKFSSLEIKLFSKYPSLKDKKLNYLINNKEIDISKTLEENNITDGSVIYYKIQEINNEDDEISVIIKSSDLAIKSSFICQKGDKFIVLQQKLYEKYPNLKKKEHYYLCNGNIVDIEKTISE